MKPGSMIPPAQGRAAQGSRGSLYGGEPSVAGAARLHPPCDDFVSSLQLTSADADAVRQCLDTFPTACTSRGMFFEGILDALARGHGKSEIEIARSAAGIDYRIQSFSLYPHRDFYLLFYYAARRLHPQLSIEQGLSRIAELFYPNMFAENLAGKTMAAFLGNDPVVVLGRLVDAYRIATPWNEHRFETRSSGPHRWTCKVEPCPFYPSTLRGIASGMLKSVTGRTVDLQVESHAPGRSEQRFVLQAHLGA